MDDCEEDEEEEYEDSWDVEGLLGPEGCLYPDKCCMPGFHWESECHTAEDLMRLEREGTDEKS